MDICVTGVSRGLGRALARSLTRRGHRVWGISRRGDALRELAAECPDGSFFGTEADVADAASLRSWIAAMASAGFAPDIVVLNASIQEGDMGVSYDHAAGRRMIETNLQGALETVALLLPAMRSRGKGRFVAVSSTSALRPSGVSAAYCASKAGVTMAFRSLRFRYGREGVSFGVATFGPLATAMWEGKSGRLVGSGEKAAERLADFALGRRARLFHPPLITFLLRATLWLPDSLFRAVSDRVFR